MRVRVNAFTILYKNTFCQASFKQFFFVDEKTCQINSIFWSGEKYIIVRQKGIHEPTYTHEKYSRIGMYVCLVEKMLLVSVSKKEEP